MKMDVVWTGNHFFPLDSSSQWMSPGVDGLLSFPSIWFLFPWMVDGQETLSHFGSMDGG
jgi:hypothetical protein